jgi:hypothetical protein
MNKEILFFGVVAICLGVLSSCMDKDGPSQNGTGVTVEVSTDTTTHSDATYQDAIFVDLDVDEVNILDLVTEDEELFDVFKPSGDVPQETQADAEMSFDVEEDEQLPKDPTDDPDQHSAFYSFPAWEVPPSSDDEQ